MHTQTLFAATSLESLLREANHYAHTIITKSASLPNTPAEDIAFIDMEISNMRDDISFSLYYLDPKYKNQIFQEIITTPISLELSRRHIKANKLGNCAEFSILALAYILENQKNALKDMTIEVIGVGMSKTDLHHTFFRIRDGVNTLHWDPTLNEVSESKTNTEGQVYFRGKKGLPNRYEKFDQEKHVAVVLATLAPMHFPYPLSKEQLVEVDKFIKDPDNKPQDRKKSTCCLM